MSPHPGDLVKLTSTQGAVSVGILMEEKHSHGLGTKAPPTMVIWKVLIPQGVYSLSREDGWKIEVVSAA
jgi:hypothetical protein